MGLVWTRVGDNLGTPGVVISFSLFAPLFSTRFFASLLSSSSSSLSFSFHIPSAFEDDGGGRERDRKRRAEDGAQQGSVGECQPPHTVHVTCLTHHTTHRGERESGDGLVGVVGV